MSASLSHVAVQLALRAQLVTCPGLPALRVWENETDTVPSAGQPYIDETFSPSPSRLLGLVRGGAVRWEGLYIVRWFALANTKLALAANCDALLALFPAGSALTASDGTLVRIRGDLAPYRGSVLRADPSRVVCTLTIPYRVDTFTAP